MDVEFLAQPFEDADSVGQRLLESLPRADGFLACIAWTQLSGLDHLRGPLRQLRDGGGTATAIVGIDGGIATAEGLREAVAVFTEVRVFHDLGWRTFHPKLYIVERGDHRLVIAGSSNLTEGGLFTNYEANVAVSLDLGDPDDARFFAAVDQYVENLGATGMPIRPLDDALIGELESKRGILGSELRRDRTLRAGHAQRERGARELFGPPPTGLSRAPRVQRQRIRPRSRPPIGTTARPAPKPVAESWSKELTISDAMRKTVGNQRAYVILGKAGHGIDQKTYFRRRFFARANWTSETMRTGNVKEIADVPFEVVLDDQVLGSFDVRIDHAENRIANQNNAPTWLHWSSLGDIVRNTDLTGYRLTLERFTDASYRLRLES